MIKTLTLIFTLVLSHSALAYVRAGIDNPMSNSYGAEAYGLNQKVPVSGTDEYRCDSTEWAEDFQSLINERLQGEHGSFEQFHAMEALRSIEKGIQNEPEFCGPPVKTDVGLRLFMQAMAEAFFVKESDCNPEAQNPNAPNGIATGFGQMDYKDAQRHRCTTPDGTKVTSNNQLKDPKTNARCVAQIMLNCAAGLPNADGNLQGPGHVNKIASGNKGELGMVGCFWQPLRKGTGGDGKGGEVNNQENREAIMEVTANFCREASRGSHNLIRLGLLKEDALCAAKGSRNCGDVQMAGGGWFNNNSGNSAL